MLPLSAFGLRRCTSCTSHQGVSSVCPRCTHRGWLLLALVSVHWIIGDFLNGWRKNAFMARTSCTGCATRAKELSLKRKLCKPRRGEYFWAPVEKNTQKFRSLERKTTFSDVRTWTWCEKMLDKGRLQQEVKSEKCGQIKSNRRHLPSLWPYGWKSCGFTILSSKIVFFF